MGMFDDIAFTMTCPACEAPLSGFQSKDGPCALAKLTPRELAAAAFDRLRDGITFYTSCEDCDMWVEVKMRHHLGIAGIAFSKETPND